MPTDVRKRARMAGRVAAEFDYETEYDEESLLCMIHSDGIDDVPDDELAGVHRYLVIATEYAGEGPADKADFFETKSAATKHMGDYARGGWTSRLWDLDADTTEPIKERAPR